MLPFEMPRIGRRASGPRDLISDVAGVTVGHHTIADGDVQTGVTVIRPHAGDPYRDKVPAASVIINGHTKAMGLTQLDELGLFETPIALTNTLCVGAVGMAQVREAIRTNPRICRGTGSCNPLVFECSDALLSDIQQLTITDRTDLETTLLLLAPAAAWSTLASRAGSVRPLASPAPTNANTPWARSCSPITASRTS